MSEWDQNETTEELWRFLEDACHYIADKASGGKVPETIPEMAELIAKELQWDPKEIHHLLAAMKTGW